MFFLGTYLAYKAMGRFVGRGEAIFLGGLMGEFNFENLVSVHELSKIYYETGKALVSKRRYREALKAFESVLRYDSTNVKALNAIVLTAIMADDLKLAQNYAETILRLTPNHFNAMIVEGLCFQKNGNYENARDCYRRVLLQDPSNVIAGENLKLISNYLEGSHSAAPTNTRHHDRVSVNLGVFVNYFEDSRYQLEKLIKLSPGGGFVSTRTTIDVGGRIAFILPFEGPRRVQGMGSVVWRGQPGMRAFSRGFGFAFQNLTRVDEIAIRDYMKTVSAGLLFK